MDLRKKHGIGTLVYPLRGNEVLLGKKLRKICVGRWNGWGGGQEKGETIRQAALREFQDESGLSANIEDLEYVGRVTFHNQKSDGWKFDAEVYLFIIRKWSGKLKPAKKEMGDPTFWPISNLPFGNMPASDKDWLPHVLAGKWIESEVWYMMDQDHVIRPTEVKFVDKLGDVD